MTGSPATDRVRSELERLMPASDAARVMLSALASWGTAPPAGAELVAFVDGPLRQALGRIFSAERSASLAGLLRAELAGEADRPTPVVEIDDRITGRLPLARNRPVPVLVVARTSGLADRLQLLAKAERATVTAQAQLAAIEVAARATPLVIVVDATDPPALAADVVVGALGGTPSHVQWIVWGAGRGYGKELAMLAELAGRTTITLLEGDGIGAMVDVIVARRA